MSTTDDTAVAADTRFQTFEALDTVISDVQATLEVLFDASVSEHSDIPEYFVRVICIAKSELEKALPLVSTIRRSESTDVKEAQQ